MSTEDVLINEKQDDQSGLIPIEKKVYPSKEKHKEKSIETQNYVTPDDNDDNPTKDNDVQSMNIDKDLINTSKEIERPKKLDTRCTEDINQCSQDMDHSDEDVDTIDDDDTPSPSQTGNWLNSKENEDSSDEDMLDNNQDKMVISDDGESSRNDSLSEIELMERTKRKRRRMHHLLLVGIDDEQAMKKRRKKKDYLKYEPPKLQGKVDIFCWRCHKPGPRLASCLHCTKVYHLKCAQIEDPKPQWVCPECEQIRRAENDEEKSKPGYINPETLRNLLFFAIKRMLTLDGAEHFIQPVDVSAYKDYCDFVLVPMDISLLKKRVRDGRYKSTESFLADVKYLLHNSYIYNSALSELTLVARQLVKIAKQECEEMHNCSDCYRHANTIKDKWFIEPCTKPHLLVWARLKGYPYWPGKVMKVHGPEVDVRFFGDHNRSMVPLANIFLFSKRPPYHIPLRHTQSLKEGKEEVQEHIEKLINIYGNFEYAPAKVQYDPKMEYGQLKMMIPSYGRKKEENLVTSSGEVTGQKNKDSAILANKIHILHKNRSPPEIKLGNNVKTIISVDKRTFAHQTTIIASNNTSIMKNDSDKKFPLKISSEKAKTLHSPGQRLIFSQKHVKIANPQDTPTPTYVSNGKSKFDLSDNSVVMNLKKKLMLSPDRKHSNDDFTQGNTSEKSVHFYPKMVVTKNQEQSIQNRLLSEQLLCPTLTTTSEQSFKEFESKHSEGNSILIKQVYVKHNNFDHNNIVPVGSNRADSLQSNTDSKLVDCDLPIKQPVILLHKLDEKLLNKHLVRVEEDNISDATKKTNTNINNFNSPSYEVDSYSFSSCARDEYPESDALISLETKGVKVDGEGKVKEMTVDEMSNSKESVTTDHNDSHPPLPNLIEIDNSESEIGLCSLLTPNEICAVRQKPIKTTQTSEEKVQKEIDECNQKEDQSSPSSKDQSQPIIIRVRKDLMRNDLLIDSKSDGDNGENPELEDIANIENQINLKDKLIQKDDLLKISIHDVYAAMEKGETKEEVLEIAKKELETLEKYYESQLIYVTNNCASKIEEIDQIFETERAKIRAKTQLECQKEKKQLMDEIKRKQWCVFCLNVAKFHCCWNTSYCSEKCQLADWPVHSKTCTQYKMRANDIDLRLNPKHKAFLTRYRTNNKILVQDVIDGHKRLNAVVNNKPKVSSLTSLNVKIDSQVPNTPTQVQKETIPASVHNVGQNSTKENMFVKLVSDNLNNGQNQNPSTSKPVMLMKNVYHPMNVIKRKVPIVASTGISSTDQLKGEQKTGQGQQKLTKPCRLIEKKRGDGTKFFWLDASPSSSGEEEGTTNMTTSNVQIVNNHRSGIKRTATWDPSTTLEAAEFAMVQTSAGFRTVPSSVSKNIQMKVCGDKIELANSKQKTATSPRKILPKLLPKEKVVTNTGNFKGVIKTLDKHEIENIMNKNHLSGFDSSVEED